MIYDANTWIGHWPFRALPRTSAADLLRRMDKHGIAKSLVASLHGLLYKDSHEANYELAKEIRAHRDRLIPGALLNPAYGGWPDDLAQCREEFGMPVLHLIPDYHGYKLTDPCAEEIVAQARKHKMVVALHFRIVDPRGRHRLDPGRHANAHDVLAFIKKFQGAKFLMLNWPGPITDDINAKPTCHYDITQFHGRGLKLGNLIEQHGARRFVFGSTMLLRYGSPALLNLQHTPMTAAQRDAIGHKNLARLIPEIK